MTNQSDIYEKKAKLAKVIEKLIEENGFEYEDMKMLSSILYAKVKYHKDA